MLLLQRWFFFRNLRDLFRSSLALFRDVLDNPQKIASLDLPTAEPAPEPPKMQHTWHSKTTPTRLAQKELQESEAVEVSIGIYIQIWTELVNWW